MSFCPHFIKDLVPVPKFYDPILKGVPGEDKRPWEFNMEGDQDILSCTLEDSGINATLNQGIDKILEAIAPKIDGMCEVMNYTAALSKIMKLIQSDSFSSNDVITTFLGASNIGSSFDLGGLCTMFCSLTQFEYNIFIKILSK